MNDRDSVMSGILKGMFGGDVGREMDDAGYVPTPVGLAVGLELGSAHFQESLKRIRRATDEQLELARLLEEIDVPDEVNLADKERIPAPAYLKIAMALLDEAGQSFDRLNAIMNRTFSKFKAKAKADPNVGQG